MRFLRLCLTLSLLGLCFILPALAAAEPPPSRIRLTVLGLENKTGDKENDHWAFSLRSVIERKLQKVDQIQVLPENGRTYALHHLEIDGSGPLDAKQAQAVAELLEAQRVIWGTISGDTKSWQAELHIRNSLKKETSPPLRATGNTVLELLDEIIRKIVVELKVTPNADTWAEMLKRETESIEALNWYSKAYWNQDTSNPIDTDLLWLRKAVELDPDFAAAHAAIAATLFSQGEFGPMEDAIRRALALNPERPFPHLLQALLRLKQGKLTEAEDAYTKALDCGKEDAQVHGRVAEFYATQSKWPEAFKYWESTRKLDPWDGANHAAIGKAYVMTGQRRKAWESLREAERFSIDNLNAELMMSEAYEALGEVPKAVEHLEKLVEAASIRKLNPKRTELFKKRLTRLEASLTSVPVDVPKPKVYTPEDLEAELTRRLTESERATIENPLMTSPEMQTWALELTQGAKTQEEQARRLFDKLNRRVPVYGESKARTALEAFQNWDNLEDPVNCQDYTKLFVTLARSVGLRAYYAHVIKDYRNTYVPHDCASVILDGKVWLVDPSYRWFGIPHKEVVLFSDLEAIAHHASQPATYDPTTYLKRIIIANKLNPSQLWNRYRLVQALAQANRWDDAERMLKEVRADDPEGWNGYFLEGLLLENKGDRTGATKLIQKSLELNPNNAASYVDLARIYYDMKEWRQARDMFRESLRHNPTLDLAATARFAILHLNEKLGDETDEEALLNALIYNAEQGNLAAQKNLARMYLKGDGVPLDNAKAFHWSVRAAEQGDLEAIKAVIQMCLSGIGTEPDPATALKWVQVAAEKGEAFAQFDLGTRYTDGKDLPKDPKIAFTMFKAAAEQGHAKAQFYLGRAYHRGEGVEKDPKEAYIWTYLAEIEVPPATLLLDKIAVDMDLDALLKIEQEAEERRRKIKAAAKRPTR